MNLDTIDLYGSAEAKEAALTDVRDAKLAAATRYTVTSALTFSLPGYGPVRAATIGTIHEGVRECNHLTSFAIN